MNDLRIENKDDKVLSVYLGRLVIFLKPPFLQSLDVLIKMFTNSLAVLNQQILGRANHVHCF